MGIGVVPVLLLVWLAGVETANIFGGLVHLLLVGGVIVFAVDLLRSWKRGEKENSR